MMSIDDEALRALVMSDTAKDDADAWKEFRRRGMQTVEEAAADEAAINAAYEVKRQAAVEVWAARWIVEAFGQLRRTRAEIAGIPTCCKPLECGSTCFEPLEHLGPCMCVGDDYAEGPGTCPA